ncbi:MAG TPA: hypothetical protein VHQ22_13665 [Terriglobales bacterium]|nr:hypothetical protein [Terriglobales bacterium]
MWRQPSLVRTMWGQPPSAVQSSEARLTATANSPTGIAFTVLTFNAEYA